MHFVLLKGGFDVFVCWVTKALFNGWQLVVVRCLFSPVHRDVLEERRLLCVLEKARNGNCVVVVKC